MCCASLRQVMVGAVLGVLVGYLVQGITSLSAGGGRAALGPIAFAT